MKRYEKIKNFSFDEMIDFLDWWDHSPACMGCPYDHTDKCYDVICPEPKMLIERWLNEEIDE